MTFKRLALVTCLVTLTLAVAFPAAADGTAYFPQSVASGDPTPSSVVLWTRVVGDDGAPADATVRLVVASDSELVHVVATRDLAAGSEHDGCVKVRMDGLEPYHDYWYQFVTTVGGLEVASPVGHTRTAPDPNVAQPLKFAVVYCEDYVGRYYNSYLKLLAEHGDDIDFTLFLGDYVYETTGDPSFQETGGERKLVFTDPDQAITLGSGDSTYLAARSLSNYRDLYRTYRSDVMLQRVHERWPMIAIWDDHEFADDSWGDTATYTDGRLDETDPDRKRAAEQAYFEYMPIGIGLSGNGMLAIDASILWPNTRTYRDLRFGTLLEVALTDYRTYRPDHIVPEDAFPGTVAVDQSTLQALLGQGTFDAVKGSFDPYVNMDLLGAALPILRQTATLIAAQAYQMEDPALGQPGSLARARAALQGNVSTTYLNALYGAAGLPAPFTPGIQATLPRGLSYLFVGKQALFSSTGSRYLLLKDSFDLLAGARAAATGGVAEDAFGRQQTSWLAGLLTQSPATWKVLTSSVMMTPLVLDFTNPILAGMLPEGFPDVLRTRLLLDADQWDGFPQARDQLLGLAAASGNTLIVSGDIHATFVTDHHNGVFEFTPPAVSSGTFGELVGKLVASDPTLSQVPGLDALVGQLAALLQLSTIDNPHVPPDIIYDRTDQHGFGLVEVTPDALYLTLEEMPATETLHSLYDDLDGALSLFRTTEFTIRDGQLLPGRQ